MSKALDEIIKLRKEKALEYEEYLQRIADLANRVAKGTGPGTPVRIDTAGKRALWNNLDQDEELALQIDRAVLEVRHDGWRGDQPKERIIKKALAVILKDKDEIERIFQIIVAQSEY
jgi:type I restriction enzyme R subunit